MNLGKEIRELDVEPVQWPQPTARPEPTPVQEPEPVQTEKV